MNARARLLALPLAVLVAGACTEGVGPDGPGSFPLALSVVAAEGISQTENDALGRAFDKIDRYQVTVKDSLTGELVTDTTILVQPGPVHTLDVAVGEKFLGRTVLVQLIAKRGPEELFRSQVVATPAEPSSVAKPGQGAAKTAFVRYTGAGVHGGVADASGNGVAGVTVTLSQGGSTVSQTTSAADGSFLFIDLAPGKYVVRLTASGGLVACPSERAIDIASAATLVVASFRLRSGSCTVDVLVVSGGDVDDTHAAAGELAGDPEISASTFFFVRSSPGLATLRQYDVVLLYMNGLFDESSALGSEIAQFVGLGGNVVFGSFYWQGHSGSGKQTPGWGGLESMDAFTSTGGASYTPGSLGSVTNHPLTAGVSSLSSSGLRGGVAAAGGTTVVASWNDGTPLVGYRTLSAGQRMVGVSLFPAHSTAGSVSGDTGTLWKNAVRWAGAAGGPAQVGGILLRRGG